MTWIKFHEELTKGSKRGMPRALRFILLELSLHARPLRGRVELPVGMSDRDAVVDLLGGNRREIDAALAAFTEGDDPTITFESDRGRRFLTIPSWAKWNAGAVEASGASTERSRRFRETQRGATAVAPPMQQRATLPRVEESRERGEGEKIQRGGVDQGPGTTARQVHLPEPPPSSLDQDQAKPKAPWSDEPPNPTVAKVLAALIAVGPVFRLVATDQFAEYLAARACTDGFTGRVFAEDIAFGIAQAADKERARLAGADELAKNGGELRKYIAGFVARIQRGEASRTPSPPPTPSRGRESPPELVSPTHRLWKRREPDPLPERPPGVPPRFRLVTGGT